MASRDFAPRCAPAAALTGAFVLAAWLARLADRDALRVVSDVLALGLALATIALSVRAARRLRSTGWWLVAATGAIWVLGDIVQELVDSASAAVAFPTVADIAYVAGLGPLLVGAWKLCHAGSSRREQMRSLFDGLVIGSSLVLAFWWAALGVIRSQGLGVIGTALALAYVLGDILVVTTVQSSRHVMDPRRHDLRLLGAAFVVVAIADATFAYQLGRGTWTGDGLPDLGWLLGYALVCWAAMLAQAPAQHTERKRIGDVYLYGSIAIALAVTSTSLLTTGRLDAVQGWGVVALAVIGVARHFASQTENEELRRRLEHQVRALSVSEERFRGVFDGIVDGIAVVDASSRLMFVNSSLAALLERSAEELIGVDVTTLLEPDEGDAVIRAGSAPGGSLQLSTATVRLPSGASIPIETTVSNLVDDPAVRGFVVTVRNISERVRRQQELTETRERFRRSFEAAPIGMALISSRGIILEANGAYAAMIGRDVDALVGADVMLFTHPDDLEHDRRSIEELVATGATQKQWEKRFVHADGHHVWVSLTISPVHLPNGDREYINQVEDITERRAALAQLAHNARHDILTGLPNRAYFEEQLAVALERAAAAETRVAVAFLDVDRFKIVNDNLGHRYGDELLRVVATRLGEAMRTGDLVARFGGDEFTAMFCDVTDSGMALSIAERLIERVCRPIELDDGETFVSLSVGLAMSVPSMDATAVDLMLSNADAAMYRAKEAGRDRIELHEDVADRSAVNRLRLLNDLHRAIERRELRLHYQPIVELGTGTITSSEALLRWDHAEHGMLPPAQFVHLAEDSGLVVPIGAWTIASVCRQLAAWNAQADGATTHPSPMRASVNLSSRQLDTGNLPTSVARLVDETGIDPDWLWFEITEGTLMRETTEVIATMRRLRDLGVHLAIDDFGTGYSSLAYLRRFPVEVLKVDRTFVAGLGEKDEDTTIVRAVIELAHALGLTAVAEGVETAAQLDALREIGCDYAQGWYFGRPADPKTIGDPRDRAAWMRPTVSGLGGPR